MIFRDVLFQTRCAAVASGRVTNLATHPRLASHPHLATHPLLSHPSPSEQHTLSGVVTSHCKLYENRQLDYIGSQHGLIKLSSMSKSRKNQSHRHIPLHE